MCSNLSKHVSTIAEQVTVAGVVRTFARGAKEQSERPGRPRKAAWLPRPKSKKPRLSAPKGREATTAPSRSVFARSSSGSSVPSMHGQRNDLTTMLLTMSALENRFCFSAASVLLGVMSMSAPSKMQMRQAQPNKQRAYPDPTDQT
jgi:hypothetical protein